jgi:CDP-diacylglycerol--glycerol-3-phosphate 3-phosphatidyltransferase
MEPNYIDRTLMRPFVGLVPRYIKPNYITAARFVSVPFVAALLLSEYFKLGFILFSVSAFTDALDGALARTRGEVTALGKIFDPIADKLLIVVTAFILISEFLPNWLFVAILAVEGLIIILALVAKYQLKIDVQSNIYGKAKMIIQTIGVLSLLIYAALWQNGALLHLAFYALLSSLVLGVFSLLYNRKNI